MTVFPQKLINVGVKTRPELSTIPEISEVIRDVEAQLGNKGRVLVRYSGTQSMCRVMVEGPMHEDTEKYCKQIAEVVREKLS
jgi:phosphoglucosamine mutase